MRISAKADYGVRAAVELAIAEGGSLSADAVARAQDIPVFFLKKIFNDLRVANLVATTRGRGGGYRLARPASAISVADVLRAIDGPLADVHGEAPENLNYEGLAEPLQDVWIALRANARAVLETVTLAHIADRRLPKRITKLASSDDARFRR
ncbi:RrF2 family transcriptional regulator [Baekduia alba]|uniref:RrF2 family transcriptional regulator n=1 Tax=Baekduia alba TaxID=2997333 RepID=UPI0023403B93|nr:Rrf2 family transcriptional regulator [Baekduia alba]